MQVFKVRYSYSKSGEFSVSAETVEEAMDKVINDDGGHFPMGNPTEWLTLFRVDETATIQLATHGNRSVRA